MSGEMGWTPGPWSVGPSHVVAHRSEDAQGRKTTRFVAEAVLAAPVREGEREANAALIAAAPDMVDLLGWITAFADIRSKDDSKVFARVNRGALRTIRDKAEAALARARGEPL